MKLLTHNLIMCNKKGVTKGFPLIIKARTLKYEETQFDKDFTLAMIPKLEWSALLQAMENLRAAGSAGTEGLPPDGLPQFPPELTEDLKQDEGFLQKLHTTLFDVHLLEGTLVCPESGREFPVEKGIPNMLLNDDEV
eukprot:CAMPEP_0194485600 /NCGR_PEP_ID=MMETSP0253-20130528/6555_1 /TAXON_ID=2966 /ORGANISM="Noctiluca scintillans" /LENGTH=136 /DNA_ID=CAMNT_0039325599 /DNA_START=46 /DNA_END=456 /DNA_ORIENTATION=-